MARPHAPADPTGIASTSCDAELTDQDGKAHGLDVYRGHPVLVTMFYGSCPAACPLIIDTLRAIEKDLTPAQRADLRVLMISIDPERDTPEALKAARRAAAHRHQPLDAGARRRRHRADDRRAPQHPVPAAAGWRVQSLDRDRAAVAAG